MKSETLITSTSPHGADLRARSGERSSKLSATKHAETLTRTRRGITSTFLIPPPKYRSAGTPDRPTQRPQWTLAELGQAAQGVPQICFAAACYRFAGDASVYWELWAALRMRAAHLGVQCHWPRTVTDLHGLEQPYIGHLAVLVLDSDAQPRQFNAKPALFAEWMRVTPRVWERDLEAKFWRLQAVFDGWCSEAAGMIQRKLRDPDADVNDDFQPINDPTC